MRRLFAHHGEPVVHDLDEPSLRAGEILVDTAFSTVSTGTELSILRRSGTEPGVDHEYPGTTPTWPKIREGTMPHLLPRPPLPLGSSLGYSAAGVVRAVGSGVSDISVGMPVACSGSQAAHHAEVICVPRNLTVPVPEQLALQQASFVTLGSIALESLRKADLRFGETVVVYGLGVLGLLAAQIAQASGMYVVGLDIDEHRRELAGELGIDDVHHPEAADEAVLRATSGFGADAVLLGVVSDSNQPLNHSLDLVRQRGTVVSLGVFGMDIERDRMGRADAVLKQTIAYGPGRYDPHYEEGGVDYPIGLVRWTENRNMAHFLRLLAERRVDVHPLAATPVTLDGASAAYASLHGSPRPATVQFRYEH